MNTNEAKEYLARREIPQLFEVRRRMRAPCCCSLCVCVYVRVRLCARARSRGRLCVFRYIYLIKHFSRGKMYVHVTTNKHLMEYIV